MDFDQNKTTIKTLLLVLRATATRKDIQQKKWPRG